MGKSTNNGLKELKEFLANGSLSFMIGAGFSKNISDKFPLFSELLEDMTAYLYEDEIKLSYHMYATGGITFEQYKKKKVYEIIDREGHLAITSQYVKRKGYRESVDVYVEERMPYLKSEGKGYSLYCDGCKIDENVDLSIHQKLIDLGVHDIYTFNYENALDLIAGTDKQQKILTDIETLELKKQTLTQEIEEFSTEVNKFKNSFNPQQEIQQSQQNDFRLKESNNISVLEDFFSLFKMKYGTQSVFDQIDFLNSLLLLGKELEEKKAEYSAKIASLSSSLTNKYCLVKGSWDISLSIGRKNIYKLHGSLRLRSDEEYGFDNDLKCQYIITQEDYDTYEEKHGAFVNLMRISLLRGAFCIIGFSGEDPNFLNWMSWIRDVLKDKRKKSHIFFIDTAKKPISKQKQLLFKNNHISYISLSEIYDKETDKERMECFLNELQDPNDLYCKNLKAIELKNFLANENLVNDLWRIQPFNRLPMLDDMRIHLIRQQIISQLIKKDINEVEAKLLYIAIVGERLFIDDIFENEDFKGRILPQIKNNCSEEVYSAYTLLDVHLQVFLHNPIEFEWKAKDDFYYEKILQEAFDFNFSEVSNLLEIWQPSSAVWRTKRIAFKALYFSTDTSEIESSLVGNDYECRQEYIYALDIIPLVRGVFYEKPGGGLSMNEDICDKKKQLLSQNESLHVLDDHMRFLNKELLINKENVQPYGSSTHTISLGGDENLPLTRSIQLLETLFTIGLPVSWNNFIYFDKDIWYVAFKNLYEMYPYPCLYISFQYGDDGSYIHRIAQDYVYSQKLKSFIPDILTKMLKAYGLSETPRKIKKGILFAAPLFLQCVSEDIWSSYFKDIFDSFDDHNTLADRRVFPVYDFFEMALQLSSNEQLKQKALSKYLEKGLKVNHTDNSIIIAACHNLKRISSENKRMIDFLLQQDTNEISSVSSAYYFVLLNMKKYMNRNQKQLFYSKMQDYGYSSSTNPVMMNAAVTIFSKNADFLQKLTVDILGSELLWYTGIGEDGRSFAGGTCIQINDIQKFLFFSDDNILVIYSKMKDALSRIEMISNNRMLSLFSRFRKILLDMKIFMFHNNKVLELETDYKEILSLINRLYNKERGAASIVEALSSSDNNVVSRGIESLVYDVRMHPSERFETEYIIIANRILTLSEAGLSSCINHFSWYLYANPSRFNRKIFKPIIAAILAVYEAYFRESDYKRWDLPAEKEMVENAMIKINTIYATKWNGQNDFWENYKRLFVTID